MGVVYVERELVDWRGMDLVSCCGVGCQHVGDAFAQFGIRVNVFVDTWPTFGDL